VQHCARDGAGLLLLGVAAPDWVWARANFNSS